MTKLHCRVKSFTRHLIQWALVVLALVAPGSPHAGELKYLQHAPSSVGIIDVTRLVISPDGHDLYLAGGNETLSHFRINETTGRVEIVHVYREGVADISGLQYFNTMTLAPAGDRLYVTSKDPDQVVTFARNNDGSLRFLGDFTDPYGLADDPQFWRMAASPDGRHLYVAGGNGAFPDHELVVFVFSHPAEVEPLVLTSILPAGAIERVAERAIPPVFVAMDPGGSVVVTGNFPSDTVRSFLRDPTTGELAHADTVWAADPGVSGLGDILELQISPDGSDVYVATGLGEWRAQVRLDPSDGDLEYTEAFQTDPGGFVSDDLRPISFSNDGRHAYVCVSGFGDGGGIEEYRRDAATGRLSLFVYLQSTNHTFNCADMALSPTGSWLYTIGLWNDTLVTYRRLDASGLLLFEDETRGESPYPDGFSETDRAVLDPTGRRLYIPAMDAAQIVVLDRSPIDGTVTPLTAFTNGENGFAGTPAPTRIVFSSDEAHAYVSNCGPWPNEGEETISVFEYQPQTGGLDLIQEIDAQYSQHYDCWGISVLTVDDPSFVYAFSERFAVTYRRDPLTGELAELDRLELADTRIRSPVAVGDQQRSVYAGNYTDPGGILTFLRDPVSGLLSFDGTVDQSSCSIGLGNPLKYLTSIVAGPDDGFVWVRGGTNAIQVFDREPATGALLYTGCDGYAHTGVAPHPHHNRLATSYGVASNSIIRWYAYDPADGVPGARAQHQTYGTERRTPFVSNDGKNVYAPYGWGGLGVFLVVPVFSDGLESGDTSAWAEVSP